MNSEQLANAIEFRLYSSRGNLDEAFDYALEIAKASDNPQGVMTAVMVVANTIANQIRLLKAE